MPYFSRLTARVVLIALLSAVIIVSAEMPRPAATELFLRGYSVIPTPQKVQLKVGDVEFSSTWTYSSSLPPSDRSVLSLIRDLRELHSIALEAGRAEGDRVVRLSVRPGAVEGLADGAIAAQAYRLDIAPARVEITGGGDAGLFYGVQTFLQLLKQGPGGKRILPVGVIEDWPSVQLRFLHWDTKHHQDRIETLKRYLDWSARFKINMIGFELEDKFEYPSHPVIGAPGAFTVEAAAGNRRLWIGALHPGGSPDPIARPSGLCAQTPGVCGPEVRRQ